MTGEAATTRPKVRARLAAALTLAAATAAVNPVMQGRAQDRPAPTAPADPRVGLAGGLRNARAAARNMELVASLPKPKGFFDPKLPAGEPTPPETQATPAAPAAGGAPLSEVPASESPAQTAAQPASADAPATAKGGAPPRSSSGGLGFANSDMAFSRDRLIVGNFNGFNAYDIRNPNSPKLIVSVVCPGGQGDVSVYGNLLFMSVEQTRGRLDCGTGGVQPTSSPDRFRGVRIFDITDLKKPKQVAGVQTCRGSHTHTLVTSPADKANVYIYGSGTSAVRPADELEGCSALGPKEDPNTALFSIDVIQVPLDAPATARIVNRPRIFADQKTGNIAGLWPGGSHGEGTQKSSATNQCHDITVLPEAGLAAGACSGNGILLDISDPVHPVRLDDVADKNFAYWHSATFNNDGSKVIFTDEWGGGTRPRCRATDLPNWGADAIFEIVDRKLRFQGYFKMPAPQTDKENCVAHNGSIVPVPGRDIMVQAWYQGGISVFDFTDTAHPVEIAFFDRGPVDPDRLITAGFWSSYWYKGRIYGTEMARGLDVFRLTPSEHLSENEIEAASQVRPEEFNAQLQTRVTWPATPVVARAYVDQLMRSNGLTPARAEAVKAALAGAERGTPGKDPEGAGRLEAVLTGLESDAAAAAGRDADRLRSLAATIRALGSATR